MKKLVSILILVSLSFQCAIQLGIMVNFGLNQDFIARTLCINKAKPELKCNGKCHLAKSLNKTQDKQEKQSSKQSKTETQFPVFVAGKSLRFSLSPQQVSAISFQVFFYQESYSTAALADFFHPPQV